MANKFKLNLFVFVNQRNQNDVGEIYFLIAYNILYTKIYFLIAYNILYIKTISSSH